MIHPTASIHPRATLGRDVSVGAYATVGEDATIGDGTLIGPHATIGKSVALGMCNIVASGACLGVSERAEVSSWRTPSVVIGDHNIIREFACITSGPDSENPTRVGDDNFLMACCHLGAGCQVGSNTILANGARIGARAFIGDGVNVSGLVRIEDAVRIGRLAMVGGVSHVDRSIPPFTLVTGNPAAPRCINYTGLKRSGLTTTHCPEELSDLKRVWWDYYRTGACRTDLTALGVAVTSALAAEFLAFNRDESASIATYGQVAD